MSGDDIFEKMDLATPDFTNDNAGKLAELFPNCVTEIGGGQYKIDFDALKQELSGDVVDGITERYQMNWPGKAESIVTGNTPIDKTLRPNRDESVNFDTTENLFIEGDNLDALKLLQETYLGKVKMIYIDPPYNTGNDFVYNDTFKSDKDEYDDEADYTDEDGGRLVANKDSNGRFHSDWLSMMYPRLRLARNLLSEDGVIFISIDDNEQANLKKLCDKVFGENNFIGGFVWRKKYGGGKGANFIVDLHEHILCYARNIGSNVKFSLPRTKEQLEIFKEKDEYYDERGGYYIRPLKSGLAERKTLIYPIECPDGSFVETQWICGQDTFKKMLSEGRIVFKKLKDDKYNIYKKFYEKDNGGEVLPESILYDIAYNQNGKEEIKKVFDIKEGRDIIFDNPKPTKLLKHFLSMLNIEDGIVLDFFAGSGTTADAIMQLNAEDGGNRKCISIQLPETAEEKSNAHKAGYSNIADISKERIRRAGAKILADNAESKEPKDLSNLDIGFRVLKIDSGIRNDIKTTPDLTSQSDLLNIVGNIKHDYSAEDLLFGCMLDWGVNLSLPIKSHTVAGKEVFGVYDKLDTEFNEPLLMACFDDNITDEFTTEVAKTHKPMRMVFKDESFDNNDSAKINTAEIFKTLSPSTEIKVI